MNLPNGVVAYASCAEQIALRYFVGEVQSHWSRAGDGNVEPGSAKGGIDVTCSNIRLFHGTDRPSWQELGRLKLEW